MARLLASKRFASMKSDLPILIELYTRSVVSLFRDAERLSYTSLEWGDAEVVQLCKLLPHCRSLKELQLGGNKIRDAGIHALAEVIADGAMAKLEVLNLHGNKIGDVGMNALAEAIKDGGLPSLKTLFMGNPGNAATVKDACARRGSRVYV